jgi:hypothetical protein
VVLTVVFNQWLAPILSGPRAHMEVGGLRSTRANTAGCTFYTFIVATDEPLDYAYAKIAFPQNIKGLKVGFPADAIASESQQIKMLPKSNSDGEIERAPSRHVPGVTCPNWDSPLARTDRTSRVLGF